jgi:hypothetical protein
MEQRTSTTNGGNTMEPMLALDAQSGELRIINGEARVALVGFIGTKDNYKTVLRWYLPKTRHEKIGARKLLSIQNA